MEGLFNNLSREYRLAMDHYDRGEYTLFFRNIRPALEWLCKFIIADQLNGKCKPEDIFSGKKQVRRAGGEYSIIEGTGFELKGRKLTETMLYSFLLNRKDVREAKYDESLKRLRENMEMYCQCVRCFYSYASASNHSAEQSRNIQDAAIKHMSILSDFITFLNQHSILKEANSDRLRTLKVIKIVDEVTLAAIESEKREMCEQFLLKKRELEAALNKIDAQEREQKQVIEKSNDLLEAKEERIRELEQEIESLKTAVSIQINSDPTADAPVRSNCELDLPDDKIDFDQEDIIMAADSESLLVSGCAGSGKSVIAMKKARQLHQQGKDVITIAYTKSLNNYMRSGITSDIGSFFYHHQWVNMNMPSADYIIVDEIQDFTGEEIQEFITAAKKQFFFFGDSAQSIYAPFKPGVMTMEQISQLTGLEPMRLFTNYRLPRPVAKITQEYVGIDVEPYSERIYKNDSSILPCVIERADSESQTSFIADLLSENQDSSIGIFLPDNASVLEFCNQLAQLDVKFEFKYEIKKGLGRQRRYKSFDTLNFTTLCPKVMTYHSAKGLQFDMVILPWFKGATSIDERKALYVAMTRTQSQLIITYSNKLGSPLDQVPAIMYKKGL